LAIGYCVMTGLARGKGISLEVLLVERLVLPAVGLFFILVEQLSSLRSGRSPFLNDRCDELPLRGTQCQGKADRPPHEVRPSGAQPQGCWRELNKPLARSAKARPTGRRTKCALAERSRQAAGVSDMNPGTQCQGKADWPPHEVRPRGAQPSGCWRERYELKPNTKMNAAGNLRRRFYLISNWFQSETAAAHATLPAPCVPAEPACAPAS